MRSILYQTQPDMNGVTLDSDRALETLPIGEDMIMEKDQGAEVTSRGNTRSGRARSRETPQRDV